MSQGIDQKVRALLDAGASQEALTLLLRTYGPEVFGYLVGVLGDRDAASEVFSGVSERVWKALGSYRWESSLRTWIYVIAKNETQRMRARAGREQRRKAPESDALEVASDIRDDTLPHLKTETKDEFAKLRAELKLEDRELLVLRLDRRLGWTEIASAFLNGDADEEALGREAARLRKRFQYVREHLGREVRRRGLVQGGTANDRQDRQP